tara:strand:- start:159 stop:875 length:717 start_codon:yes stop_codon:yes gene_type:complete
MMGGYISRDREPDLAASFGALEEKQLSVSQPLARNGVLQPGKVYFIPARCGAAVVLEKGQMLTLINVSGLQVCDMWAFNTSDPDEFLSMEHTRTHLGRLVPVVGDSMVSNRRNEILELVEDTSPGVHDTLIAACDINRYRQLGVSEYHDNCVDNLRMALLAIGKEVSHVPSPFNVWMNVPLDGDGSLTFVPPVAKRDDRIVFKAMMTCYVVMSCCPQDITAVNGVGSQTESIGVMLGD